MDNETYEHLRQELLAGRDVYLVGGRRIGKMRITEELIVNCLGCGAKLSDEDKKSNTVYKCPECGATSALVSKENPVIDMASNIDSVHLRKILDN
jgi:predicted RNA-binding Zn-ribbon protein involved in translation (DUF1610 family)